jgi:lipocalin-like protein
MNRIRAYAVVAAPLLFLGIALPAAAQSLKDMAGTWTIVSAQTTQGGKTSDTFGPRPQGSLIIDPNGRYSLMILSSGLPKFAANSRDKGTSDENKAVVAGSITHFGRISVDEPKKTFAFHIESSTYPNWNGTTQNRTFTLTKEELSYGVAAASAGGSAKVVWRRAK